MSPKIRFARVAASCALLGVAPSAFAQASLGAGAVGATQPLGKCPVMDHTYTPTAAGQQESKTGQEEAAHHNRGHGSPRSTCQ